MKSKHLKEIHEQKYAGTCLGDIEEEPRRYPNDHLIPGKSNMKLAERTDFLLSQATLNKRAGGHGLYVSTKDIDEETWLHLRHCGIGSSDTAAALGVSAYKTPLELWLEKTADQPKNLNDGSDWLRQKLRTGNAMEPIIAQLFSEDFGYQVQNDNKIRIHPDHPFILANIDRLLLPKEPDEKGFGILEIKTTGMFPYLKWDEADQVVSLPGKYAGSNDAMKYERLVPVEYWIQVQEQMIASGFTWGYFAVFIDGFMLRAWKFTLNEDYAQKTIIPGLQEFWGYVLNHQMPPAQNAADIERMFPKENGKYIPANDIIIQTQKEYWELNEQKKELESKLETIKDDFKGLIGENEGILNGTRKVATWKQRPEQEISFIKKAYRHLDIKKPE